MPTQTKDVQIENHQYLTVVVYADEIVLISETEDEPGNATCILLNKEIGQNTKETKLKYTILSRQNRITNRLKVD